METTLPAAARDSAALPEESSSDSKKVLNNSIVLMIRQGFLWTMNGVLVLFMPRYLGAEGMGQYQLAMSLTALVGVVFGLGTRQFIVKEVARNNKLADHYMGATLGTRVLLGLVSAFVLVGIVKIAGYTSIEERVIYVTAVGAIALGTARLLSGFSHGFEDMNGPAFAEVAGKFAAVVIGVPVLILLKDVVAYSAVVAVGSIVFLVVLVYKMQSLVRLRINFNKEVMKTLIMGGIPFLFMAVILEMYNNVDVIILRAYTNEEVTGWYSAALQFYRTVEMFPVALTTALLPTLSRLHTTNTKVLAEITVKSISVSALVIVPLSLGVSFLSGDLITFLPYPDTFDNSVPLLTLLALTIPVTTFLTVLGTIAISVDRQRVWAYALAGTLLLDVVLNLFFVPYFDVHYNNGAIGASITTLIAELVMVVVGVWVMPKGVIGREMKLLLTKVLLAAGVMSGISAIGLLIGFWEPPFVFAGSLAYLAIVFGTRAVTIAEIKTLMESVFNRKRAALAATAATNDGGETA